MTFKTYHIRLHIQIIYCQLIGCRPVVTKPNYQQYDISSQYHDMNKNACNSAFDSAIWSLSLI